MHTPQQPDFFAPPEPPVIAAWGVGVDSTAMIIEALAIGERIDCVLFADPGSEKPATYAVLPTLRAYIEARGVPVHIVRYQPKQFKTYPAYFSLEQNCLAQGTLPSKVFGSMGSCSQKWKAAPQHTWTKAWQPAIDAWAAGLKVVKMIGYDCSPRDSQRYAEAQGYANIDARYDFDYPLRRWGFTREKCIERIAKEGLPIPEKSSCLFCPAMKPAEVDALDPSRLRRIVLMEARAKPRLDPEKIHGLWRKPIKGVRDPSKARPGSMTEYIRQRGLLPEIEIDSIIENGTNDLISFLAAAAETDLEHRPPMAEWLERFDKSFPALSTMGTP